MLPAELKSRSHVPWLLFALLAVTVTVLFRPGGLPLINPDEGRNAEVAREMKESGSWLVPTYNGLPYLDKPAFYFKAVALSLAVFGDNELGARIPSALFALGVLGLTGWITRRDVGARPAALAVLVVTTLPLFLSQARIVIFDMALAFFVCLSILAGFVAESPGNARRRTWYLVGAAAAGCATLVKGPVGFVLPLLVLASYHVLERRWDALRRLLHPLHFLVVILVVAPWFLGVSREHPDFPAYGLVEESFKRFTTRQFRRTAPPYYYLVVLPVTFLPWSLLIPGAALPAFRQWRSLPAISRLSIVWSLSVVTFFSLSQSKLPGYILSVTVPFGILVSQLIERAMQYPAGRCARLLRGAAMALAITALLLAAALVIVAPQTGLLARPLVIPRVDLNRFLPHLTAVLVMLLCVGCANAASVWRRTVGGAVISIAALPLLLIVLGRGVFREVFESRSAVRMAAHIRQLPEGTELVFLRCFPAGLSFYLRRTGTLITTDGSELTSNYIEYALKRTADWPSPVVRLDDFEEWLAARKAPVYLMVQDNERDRFLALADARAIPVDEYPRRFRGMLLPPRRGF